MFSIKKILKTNHSLLKYQSYIDFLLLLILSITCLALYFYQSSWPFFFKDIEPKLKILFLNDIDSPFSFFPGEYPDSVFFGHPGLHQFLLYCFVAIFGKSALSILLFNLLVSIASLGCFWKAIGIINDNKKSNSFVFLIFVSFGLFVPLTFKFYQDIPAFGMSMLGIYYFRNGKIYLSSLCFTFATLILESYIAFPISIILFGVISKKSIKTLIPFFLPAILLSTFFILQLSSTGHFSHSVTARSFFNKEEAEYIRSWADILSGVKTFISLFWRELIIVCVLGAYSFWKKSQNNLVVAVQSLPILSFTALQFLVFYICINVLPTYRDFLIIKALFLILIFKLMENKKEDQLEIFKFIVIIFLLIGNISSFKNLHLNEPLERAKIISFLNEDLKTVPEDSVFWDEDPQRYFASEFAGLGKKSFKRTKEFEKATIYLELGRILCFNPGDKNCSPLYQPLYSQEELNQMSFKLYKSRGISIINDINLEYKIYLK